MFAMRIFKKIGIYSCIFAGSVYGVSLAIGKDQELKYLIGGLIRGTRCARSGLIVARKYLKEGISEETHEFAAKNLYQCFQKNGGCYIKLGQIICQLQHILPAAYVKELEPLCQECPVTDFKEVKKFLEKEYKNNYDTSLESIYEKIDPEPLGSASIAQVHKAYLKDGTPVAIKVQHSNIPIHCPGDIMTVQIGCQLAEWLFPDFKYKWLAKEFKINLPKEIDFNNEGKNADIIRKFFKDDDRVIVGIPKIYWEYTTPKVLVMSFEEGSSIIDSKYIRENKINMKEIAKNLTDIFNKQIFKFGFIHSDPHPGNIFIRNEFDKHGNKNLKIVLLDHGLYRDIDDKFRYNYMHLWRGIVNQDKEVLKQSCNNLGIEKVELFMSILTSRTYDDLMNKSNKYTTDKRFGLKKTSEEKDKLKRYAQIYHKEITHVLTGVRREMLLLLKINEFLRNIDRKIGNPYNTIENTIEHIYRELKNFKDSRIDGYLRFRLFREYYQLKIIFKLFEVFYGIYNFVFFWRSKSQELEAEEVFESKY